MSSNVVQKCSKCGSEKIKIGYTYKSNGSIVYPPYCEDCGTVDTHCIKKTDAIKIKYELKLVYFKSHIKGYSNNKCVVCGNKDVELHHFAPVHLFGSEAEKWPKAYLCRLHHKQWHDLVTPNMCNK